MLSERCVLAHVYLLDWMVWVKTPYGQCPPFLLGGDSLTSDLSGSRTHTHTQKPRYLHTQPQPASCPPTRCPPEEVRVTGLFSQAVKVPLKFIGAFLNPRVAQQGNQLLSLFSNTASNSTSNSWCEPAVKLTAISRHQKCSHCWRRLVVRCLSLLRINRAQTVSDWTSSLWLDQCRSEAFLIHNVFKPVLRSVTLKPHILQYWIKYN